MRKVYVELHVRLVVTMDEGLGIDELIEDAEWDFEPRTDKATVEDVEITHYEVLDSK